MTRTALGTFAAAAVLLIGVAAPGVAGPVEQKSYVVALESGSSDVAATASELARSYGGEIGFVYEHALQGFSIWTAPSAAAALAQNPHVAYVVSDMVRTIAIQEIPTGIQRIFASGSPSLDIDGTDDYRVDVDVAVIDTGVDWQHPDLDVVNGVNCAQGTSSSATCSGNGDDDHYHGTHVAGTIAAIDNGIGVVGVAPGAHIWSVKVLDSRGSGWTSWVIAGIDWVAARAGQIEVANMSLGGGGFNQAEYDAIQGAVDAGVAFAVAAGNADADASNYSPAAFDNVLTVSALADFNGSPGGGAPPTCRTDQDDTLADFSNWGNAVDITAPGVCILSTFPLERGEYGTISGTSMASPHVAGALALLASTNNPNNTTDVLALYNQVKSAGNLNWTDDSGDGIKEPLVDVSTFVPSLIAAPDSKVILVSSTSGGTVGGVSFRDEDILAFDTVARTWSMYFDGSDVGLGGSSYSDVDGSLLLADGSLLLSFTGPTSIPNVGGVDDSDIVRFSPVSLGSNTSGTFDMYFDGSDVGLTTNGEDVDAIAQLDDGRLVVSTVGSFSVPGVGGGDEDLIAFTPTSLGSGTSGTWSLYFDGSDVGLNTTSSEDVNALWIDPQTGELYLSTLGTFAVAGVSGSGADVFVCTPASLGTSTSCTFRMGWDGSVNGYGSEVLDGFFQA